MSIPSSPEARSPQLALETASGRAVLSSSTVALAAGFCVLWSSAFVAGKFALRSCPPLLLLSARFLLAAALMLLLTRALGQSFPRGWRQWAWVALLGLLNNTIYLGLLFAGLQTVSAGLAAVIVSANPLLTALLAHFVLGERLSLSKLCGLALGLAGVAFVMRHRAQLGVDASSGIWLTTLGTAAFALATVLLKRARLPLSLLSTNATQTLFGGLGLLPAALWLEDPRAVQLDATLWLSFGYLVLVISVAAVLIWFRLLQTTRASSASALHFLNPVLGMLLGWLLLGEPIFALDFAGILPIAAGILLVTRQA